MKDKSFTVWYCNTEHNHIYRIWNGNRKYIPSCSYLLNIFLCTTVG